MGKEQKKTDIRIHQKDNRLELTFNGVISKKDLNELYTDVRFGVADLQPGFTVISDLSNCKFMYLDGLSTFRKISNYILSKESGEIVRVINPNRVISKQIINLALLKPGYKPIYASTREEAETKLNNSVKRDGLRFQLHQQPVDIIHNGRNGSSYILNISPSGCAITSTESQLNLGDEIQIKFALTDKDSAGEFDLKANVVRVESNTFAVKFIDFDSQQRALLWACLLEKNA